MRALYDTTKIQFRLLNSLGQDCANYGPMLIPVLSKKLPSELNLQISRKCGKNIWDIRKVLDLINLEIEARQKLWCMRKKVRAIECSPVRLYSQHQIRVILKSVYSAIKKIVNLINVK